MVHTILDYWRIDCVTGRFRDQYLMVSVVKSVSSSPGFKPWVADHHFVFLDKTLHSHNASLIFTQVYKWVLVNLILGVTLEWGGILSRGE